MTIFHAIILGIVEGLTEFLPVSSTGHLIIVGRLLQIPETDFLKSFDIVIQLGAILAVVVLYFRRFLEWETIKRLVVAFIPTGVIGLATYKLVKQYLLGSTTVVIWSLLLGGIALILFELKHREPADGIDDVKKITYKQALGIGLFQAIAIIPGVSRSAATIVGGLLLGLKRRTIVEFSFLLAVPTMLAATGLDLVKSAGTFSANQAGTLVLGGGVAFIVAMLGIAFLLDFIKKHTFIPFGIYRIVVALGFLLLLTRT